MPQGSWCDADLVACRAEEIHKDLNNIAKSSNAKEPVRYQAAELARAYAGHLADCGRAMVGPSSPAQHATGALRQASHDQASHDQCRASK